MRGFRQWTFTALAALCTALFGNCASAADGGSALAHAPCDPAGQRQQVAVEFSAPEAQQVISLVALIGYDSTLVGLPSGADAVAIKRRVNGRDRNAILTASGAGDAVRVVAAKAGGLTPGPLADIELDRCSGAPAPAASALRCTVESCAGSGGPIPGCTCTISLP